MLHLGCGWVDRFGFCGLLGWVVNLLMLGDAAVGFGGRISGKTVHPHCGGGFCHHPATKPTTMRRMGAEPTTVRRMGANPTTVSDKKDRPLCHVRVGAVVVVGLSPPGSREPPQGGSWV